ncbi:hypothetical protein CAEBREN_25605 [Caenorhabditis brenneri]|uniref:C2H2-type domain-containing protein n=1 Tax=Caenorhabditis brenneri TaxID=135651 RepID=G0MH67_CAEBE|nr:hypothetical protein CAEBREN_25605 [Caenorhabditis brenneri]
MSFQAKDPQINNIVRNPSEPSTSNADEPFYVCDNRTPKKSSVRESISYSEKEGGGDDAEDECYFNRKRRSPLETQERPKRFDVSCSCSGPMTSDLNFEDPNVVLEWSKKSICDKHKTELLDDWANYKYNHIFRRIERSSKRVACSVAGTLGFNHENGKQPFIRGRNKYELNQSEANAILKNNHVLLHPGIPVCPEHKKYAKAALSQRGVEDKGYVLSPPPEENGLMSDSDDVDNESHHQGRMHYEDPDYRARTTPLSNERYTVSEQIRDAFYHFAETAGQKRYISFKQFSDLQPDTKRKKSLILRHLLKVMTHIMAPDSPEELRSMAIGEDAKSIWGVNSDQELSRVLEYSSKLYYQTESRTERLHLLSYFSPLLSLSHIQQYIPGLSKSMYYHSKKLTQKEIVKVSGRRERYDPIKVQLFVEFITSNVVTSSHTFGVKKGTLSDGSIIELPNTIRKQGATEIIRMYKMHLIEQNMEDKKMSDSTYFRILSACPATKQSGAVCVDYFMADMLEAQEKINEILNNWYQNGKIPSAYRDQLIRGIEESVNYFRTDFRIHLSQESTTADHCMQHALSDPVKPDFQVQCDHDHSIKCDRCEMVKNIEGELLDYSDSLVKNAENNDQSAVGTYQEQYGTIKNCLKKMFEFKRHVLRSKYTDQHRAHILSNLGEDEAMITLDFAQKLLPMKFYETQLDYFGKRGMSYHIAHVMANVSETLVSHSFVHILKDGAQDNQIVTAILTHILSELGSLGIKAVYLRSDNAGCYHSARTLFSLSTISEKTGVEVSRYSFSEPQNGKSSCDRVASQIKRQVREYVDLKNDVTTPEEFFQAVTARPLRGVSYYLADLNDRDSSKRKPATITGMSGLYDFEIDRYYLTARRYFGIGDGIKVKVDSKQANEATLAIIDQGGNTARKTNTIKEKSSIARRPHGLPSFWRLGHAVVKRFFSTSHYDENVALQDVHQEELHDHVLRIFRCPVAGCSARFLYFGSLEHHLDRGKHNSASERRTLRDEALHNFRLHLEDLIVPASKRIAAVTNALQKLRLHKNDQLLNLPIGWAIRTRAKQGRFSETVHTWLKDIYDSGRKGRKKTGKEVELMMKTAVNEDGNVLFSVEERLNWRQIQSVFSQLTRKDDDKEANRAKRNAEKVETETEETSNEYSFQFEESYQDEAGPNLPDILWMKIKTDRSIFLGDDEEDEEDEEDESDVVIIPEADSSRRRSHSPEKSRKFKRIRDELFL